MFKIIYFAPPFNNSTIVPLQRFLLAINSKTKRWWRCAKLRKIKNVLKREWKKQIINFWNFFSFNRAHEKKHSERAEKNKNLVEVRDTRNDVFITTIWGKRRHHKYIVPFFSAADVASILFLRHTSRNSVSYIDSQNIHWWKLSHAHLVLVSSLWSEY